MAAVLACGPGAVLSHRSAAALHELRDWGGTKIEVTVPRRSRRKHDGVAVHCSTTLTAKDITVVNNIPCSTVARTLLDLAEVVTRRQLERSFDQAEIAEVFDLERHPGPARPQPHSPRCESRAPGPRDALHRQDADLERERGGAAGDHPASRDPRPGHQPVRDPRRRRPGDPRRLRLARAAGRCRGRQPQVAPDPPAVRVRPSARPAPYRRRLEGHPHHVAADEATGRTSCGRCSSSYCRRRPGLELRAADQPLPAPRGPRHLVRRAPAEALHPPAPRPISATSGPRARHSTSSGRARGPSPRRATSSARRRARTARSS